ncbi:MULTISPECIES: glycerophosphodiester phosphodiesterase family protein [unclassified Algibacter]|uniref:glycerophosphodiester phosphodiesterase family protein n=1 Tax=unclassified Algibacter TaxID=2615009 RepID=UPI00131DB2EA|nr:MULTISPECIES: glycerophosphodiester phosphodiesterase family protein [unclassified Algibacter]MCL5129678.1 glycerophosphodiester phosphodiesterase family protein [Algibacter sp. L4_22]
MKYIVILCLFLASFSCKEKTEKQTETNNKSVLVSRFAYQSNKAPIISVHRGGKSIENYPENCLETLKYINDSIPAVYEIDIAKTKDNVLVLMHDNSLGRTSTGEGDITNYTYQELLQYNLEDDFGNETTFKIPLFKDVLLWAKSNNVILTIDIKKSVSVTQVVALVEETGAEDISVIITYDMKQASAAYKASTDLLLSVSARNEEELDWLLHSEIPTENMIAFTGTRLSSEAFYKKLHDLGITCMLGTLGNLDKQAQAKGDHLYQKWVDMGVDVIATDRPFAAAASLNITK